MSDYALPGSDPGVPRTNPSGLHSDQHLTFARQRSRDLFKRDHFRSAKLMDARGLHRQDIDDCRLAISMPWKSSLGSDIRILSCEADVFRLGEKAERFLAALAPDAALFHPAERDAQVAHQPAVHPDGAGVDLFRDAMGAG